MPRTPATDRLFTNILIANAIISLVIWYLMQTERIIVPESLEKYVKIWYWETGYAVSGAILRTGMIRWLLKAAVIIVALPFAAVYQIWYLVRDISIRLKNQRRFMAAFAGPGLEGKLSLPPGATKQPSAPNGDDGPVTIPESTYQYVPLQKDDEIRLLELIPVVEEGGDNTTLRGRIVHARLSDMPQYASLSYCWNDEAYTSAAATKTNTVLDLGSDGILVLTPNLFAGLRSAQRKGHFDSRLFWVDQICINQQDLTEKSIQVALMKDIYKEAAFVLIWIGDDTATHDGKTALRFAERIAACIDEKGLLSPDFDFFPITFTSNDLGLPPVHTAVAEYMSLIMLLMRPWFSRSWVVQEVCLGNMAEKRVLLGDTEASFDAVASALLFCTKSMEFLMDWIPTESRAAFRAMIQSSLFVKRDVGRPSSALIDILVRHRGCQAALARDKVFAFLNISDDGEKLGIKADYTTCTRQVMIDTAVAMLKHYSNLDILSSSNAWPDGNTNGKVTTDPKLPMKTECTDGTVACPHSDHAPNLPSWVPDWSKPSFAPSFQARGEFGEYFSDYCASGDSFKEVQFRENNTQLGLRGTLADRIVSVGPGFVENHGLDIGSYYRVTKIWGDMCGAWKKGTEDYTPGEDMLSAFAATLTCGGRDVAIQSSKSRPTTDSSQDKEALFGHPNFTAQFNQLVVVFMTNWVLDTIWSGVAGHPIAYNVLHGLIGIPIGLWVLFLSKLGLANPLASVSSGFRRRFFASVNHRRFFRTEYGFIGLGSPQMVVGDYVGIFAGGRVPIIVREASAPGDPNTLLEVVGDAYVHRFMFGDVWNMDHIKPQTWWFC